MDSFLFALGAVLPIILTVALGYLLKKLGLMNESFSKAANKLVFRVFLPVMLFLNVYSIEDLAAVNFGYILYAVIGTVVIFLVAIPVSMVITKESARRGSVLQSAFRSNYALIGIPLATSLYGTEGGIMASLLSAIIVPIFNILAVISLSLFRKDGKKPSVKSILLGIAKNPLIIGILSGLLALGVRALLTKAGITFRLSDITPVYTVLEYLSRMATPMALLVLGAQFEFSAAAELKKEIISATLIRTVAVPLLGLGVALLFFRNTFNGAQFAALVAVFATPVAVSSVPMAQEMGSDSRLSGQIVIFTTLVSAFTVFLITFLLKLIGVFG